MCVLTQMSGTLRALSSGAPAWTSPGSCKQTWWDTGSERVTSAIQKWKVYSEGSGEGWDAGAPPRIPHVLSPSLCSHGLRLMVKVVPEPRAMAAGVWRLSANQASQAKADGYMSQAGRAAVTRYFNNSFMISFHSAGQNCSQNSCEEKLRHG